MGGGNKTEAEMENMNDGVHCDPQSENKAIGEFTKITVQGIHQIEDSEYEMVDEHPAPPTSDEVNKSDLDDDKGEAEAHEGQTQHEDNGEEEAQEGKTQDEEAQEGQTQHDSGQDEMEESNNKLVSETSWVPGSKLKSSFAVKVTGVVDKLRGDVWPCIGHAISLAKRKNKGVIIVLLASIAIGLFARCPTSPVSSVTALPQCIPVYLSKEVTSVFLSFGTLVIEEVRNVRHRVEAKAARALDRAINREVKVRPNLGRTLLSLQEAHVLAEGNFGPAFKQVAAAEVAEKALRETVANLQIGKFKLSRRLELKMTELVDLAHVIAREYRSHVEDFEAVFLSERSIFDFLSDRIYKLVGAMIRRDNAVVESIIRSMAERFDRFHESIMSLKKKHESLKERVYSKRDDFKEIRYEIDALSREDEGRFARLLSALSWFFAGGESWKDEKGTPGRVVGQTTSGLDAVLNELQQRSLLYRVVLNDIVATRDGTTDANSRAPPVYGNDYAELVMEDLLRGFRGLAESYTSLLTRTSSVLPWHLPPF